MSEQLKCETHPTQEIIFVCLFKECTNSRLGCQKCLLQHHAACIKGCLFLSDLNSKAFAWSGDEQDIGIEQFIKKKATGVVEIDQAVDEVLELLLQQTKQVKKEVLVKRIKGKSEVQKNAKQFLTHYQQAFSIEGLREAVVNYHEDKITEAQLTTQVNDLSKMRAELEDQNKKGKLQSVLPTLAKEDLKLKEKDIVVHLSGINNFVTFSQGWEFIKSTLSKTNNQAQNIKEVTAGVEFEFNEKDNYQLVYGNQRWREGKHQWEIHVSLVDSVEKKEQTEEKKEEAPQPSEGLESIISGNPNQFGFGQSQTQNTGMFQEPEYKYLNRLYIGIVSDSRKDQTSNYITGSQECEGVDIIRGQFLGNMYMNGSGGSQIQVAFKNKKAQGITITCTLNIESKHISIKEKDSTVSYDATYYTQGAVDWRPFVMAKKSKLRVKLNV